MPPSLPSRGFARAVLSNPASKSTHPTPTSTSTATSLVQKIHDFASRTLHPRLETDVSTVPEGYGRNQNGPDAGTVVGIVLGSVAGFILLFWIIYWCVNLGNPTVGIEEGSVGGGGSSSVVFNATSLCHMSVVIIQMVSLISTRYEPRADAPCTIYRNTSLIHSGDRTLSTDVVG